jgi:predicted secreted protein
MSVRTVFGARFVAVASLASVLALAGCSSSPGVDPAGAKTTVGAATAAPVARTSPSAAVPVVANLPSATSQLAVHCDAFATKPKGSADVHLKAGDVMALTLCTNASTGFSWEQPLIAGDGVGLLGTSTGMPASGSANAAATVPPLGAAPSAANGVAGANTTTAVSQGPGAAIGAATTTTFLLKAQRVGTTTVHLSYSRPWAGGEKNVWEYTLNVTID